MKIAIVTGASSGIGAEFVRQLDKSESFDEIWVIARREDRLEILKEGSTAIIRPIPLDLTLNESLEKLEILLIEANPEISVLVNAGGFGKFGGFEQIPLSEQLGMIDLNAKALTAVTYLCIPYMKKGSRIYQMSSISAFQPIPYIGVYAATKSFVLSFSRALNIELKNKGIRTLAVCPFWTKTEFFDRAVNDNTVKYYARFLSAEQVVSRALRDMRKGKDVSVCGFTNRLQVLAVKLLPHKIIMKIWCSQQDLPC